ncbi:unnamed protein product [marine sediment metagenome]|uniref:Uncharacterized protein n=1 Tax=marine sediment metagenome TaxID=412755 RepID=X1N1H8_9ZZZZ
MDEDANKTADAQKRACTFSKSLTINIGQYESVKLGVAEATSFEACDEVLLAELRRLGLPVTKKIQQAIKWGR